MTTFHSFPLLPLELRIQIWEDALHSTIPNRVLTVRKVGRTTQPVYLSPNPPPALMHACHESRKYASYHYRKQFTMKGIPRYIWANMSTDIVHINGDFMMALAFRNIPSGSSQEMNDIRHLQLELDFGREETNIFYSNYRVVPDFPALETCDVIVRDGLSAWAPVVRNGAWGNRWGKECYVRVLDRETGEWVDAATAGAYEDWIYTDHGANMDFNEEDRDRIEEDKEERYEKMMVVMRNPLPRIDLESRGVLRGAEPAMW
jgi:hypothetical protein